MKNLEVFQHVITVNGPVDAVILVDREALIVAIETGGYEVGFTCELEVYSLVDGGLLYTLKNPPMGRATLLRRFDR